MAEKVAQNDAVGEFNNIGIGLGTMAGVGGTVGGMVSGMMNDAINSVSKPSNNDNETVQFCEECGAKIIKGAEFCGECGTKIRKLNYVCKKCGYYKKEEVIKNENKEEK